MGKDWIVAKKGRGWTRNLSNKIMSNVGIVERRGPRHAKLSVIRLLRARKNIEGVEKG